jgi:hypothetical protein
LPTESNHPVNANEMRSISNGWNYYRAITDYHWIDSSEVAQLDARLTVESHLSFFTRTNRPTL